MLADALAGRSTQIVALAGIAWVTWTVWSYVTSPLRKYPGPFLAGEFFSFCFCDEDVLPHNKAGVSRLGRGTPAHCGNTAARRGIWSASAAGKNARIVAPCALCALCAVCAMCDLLLMLLC